ncbi:MAG: DMT family transporter [Veillonellales bacterium]
MNWIYLLISFFGGVGLAFQASVNGELGQKIGTFETSLIGYTVGAVMLLCITLLFGHGNILMAANVTKWKLFVGVLGAMYMFIMVLSVPKIGAASAIIAGIMGQLVLGMISDHFGLFGSPVIHFSGYRMAGIVLMFVATLLFYKR